jgi:hypothetical protein
METKTYQALPQALLVSGKRSAESIGKVPGTESLNRLLRWICTYYNRKEGVRQGFSEVRTGAAGLTGVARWGIFW